MLIDQLKRYIAHLVDSSLDARLADLRRELVSDEFIHKLAHSLSNTPVVWGGDWSRVDVGSEVNLVNSLLNVTSGRIVIGDRTFFGHNVSLLTGTHNVDGGGDDRRGYPHEGRDIIIGCDVWIASGAIVIGPCHIGDGAVIGAGAVVTTDQVEAHSVYVGCPAKRIR
ncbi:acyltransferase [Nitratireductor aquibiodomus]|uniref:acyltransferase n=1 Tax=Nitratireductor aquibiodomus TaxID=204799 RepID=UPI00138DDEF3|nr:acyltransferase [Nitratireductor aquibiodomus]